MIENQYKMEDSLFPVKEVAAVGITKLGKPDNPITDTGYKFVIRKDTGQILSCMTNAYKTISNNDIMDNAIPILEQKGAVLTDVRIFGGGARTKWTYRLNDTKVKVAADDYLNPEITITNSYDGSTEASAHGGAFRLICLNGMTIGYSLSKEGSKHIVWDKSDEIEKIINNVINKTLKVFDNDFPMMIEKEVKKKHVGKAIEMFPGYVMESMVQNLLAEPPKNYWNLLNNCTWVATHAMKRSSESTHKFESKIFDKIKKFAAEA
tara:strand:+ start:389 stop:1180 length:792 start_codon:yes stop_codon:yes gene_type:complete